MEAGDMKGATRIIDPVAVLKEVSKLVDAIKNNKGSKSNESLMKELRSQICKENAVHAVTACQGLLALVEDDVLSPMHALSMLVSAFAHIHNFAGVTAALGVLLRWDLKCRPAPYKCPFSLLAPQHPLITLLKQRKDTWPDVFRLMQNFCFHHDSSIKENSVAMLQPLLTYVLCDPQTFPHLPMECRQDTWSLLLRLLNYMPARQLVFQILPWFQLADESRCVEAGILLLELCESALASSDSPLCLALAPLAAASTRTLVTRAADPEPCLATLIRLLHVAPNAASCVMLLLADSVTVCPATYLASLVHSCKEILSLRACSAVSAYAVLSSLLPWLASPSLLTRDALQQASEFLSAVKDSASGQWHSKTSRLCASPWFRLLRHSHQDVHVAAELCRIVESWRSDQEAAEWLSLVNQSSPDLAARFSPLFCSLFICGISSDSLSDDLEWAALSTLLWAVDERPELSGRVALVLLYQLAQEERAVQQLTLLRGLTLMGKQEENMVLVLGVLKALPLGGPNSATLSLDLYLRLWRAQPRAYRFLHEILVAPNKTDNPDILWEINIAKAVAIKEICVVNPDAHGSEQVSLLSQLLTACTGSEGTVASTLAVQGITALCRAGIMDVASTWRGLAPRLVHDKRPGVVVSLCELLSVVSLLPTTTGKFEDFIAEVIITLWKWAMHDNGKIACAALKGLSEFHMDQLTLKMIPAKFRQDLQLPPSFCKTPIDAKRDPVEVLPYIPGECWKQVLEGLGHQDDRSESVLDMLASWLRNEIKSFHRGLYNQVPGRPEPSQYEHLPDSSVLKIVFRLAYQPKHDAAIASLALQILAKDFPRPLPPVTWNFLEEKLTASKDRLVRKSCLLILAKQCKSSSSAARLLLAHLGSMDVPASTEDCKVLFSKLLCLCQGIPPNHLGPFVKNCLQYALTSLRQDESDNGLLLQTYLTDLKIALQSPDLHEATMTTLSEIVESLMEKLDVEHPVFNSYIDCALSLPNKNIERMTSPSLWWEVTREKLLCSVRICSAIAAAQDSDMPLAVLNECIDASAHSGPVERESVMSSLIHVVQKCRSHSSNSRWLLQFMGRIQAMKVDSTPDPDVKSQVLQYLCDVLILAVVVLAGHDVLVGQPLVLATSQQDRLLLFPQAVPALLNSDASWSKLTTQMMEWLHHMSVAKDIPEMMANAFRCAITPLRYHEHFRKPAVWMRIF